MREGFIPEYYKAYLAKPNESLFEHTKLLLDCLDKFREYLADKEFEMLEYCCLYHDIGKINPLFQERVVADSFRMFDATKEIGHNVLSFLYAFQHTGDIPIQVEYMQLLFYIVLNHHSYVNNFDVLGSKKQLIIKNYQNTFGNEEDVLSSKRLKRILKELCKKMDIRQVVLKGFFHRCDYAASAHCQVEIENNDLTARLNDKGYQWNDMQEFAEAHSGRNIIIIGSTGLGKTEASLLWQGEGKGFYVLPVRTAINAMYHRIVRDFYADDYKEQVGLLHSGTQNIYLHDESIQDTHSFGEYFTLTKNRALPLTVCTPDQIFKFVFKYPGYEADVATFSYSRIIIDEIQAYSPELLAVLIYGLQMIHKAGGRFAITTATLPPVIREWLDFDQDEKGNIIENKIDLVEGQFLRKDVRHKVKLIDAALEADDIIAFYESHIGQKSVKILVVVNTVTSAQQLYSQMTLRLDNVQVRLLHSKFIVKDRKRLETDIIDDGRSENHKHVIWIATQVVEASLDLDFDVLFTEFSELSGLFQRMGRCNRKGLKPITEQPNVYVYEQIEDGLLCRKKASIGDKKNGFIYYSLYQLGREALHQWAAKTQSAEMNEVDKVAMMNEFYTRSQIEEIEKDTSYASYLADYQKRFSRLFTISGLDIQGEKLQDTFRNIVSINAIPSNVYDAEKDIFDEIVNEIKETAKNFRESGETGQKEALRMKLLMLKNEMNEYTLSVEPYRVDTKRYLLDRWEKVYITDTKYTYDSKKGLHKPEDEVMFW